MIRRWHLHHLAQDSSTVYMGFPHLMALAPGRPWRKWRKRFAHTHIQEVDSIAKGIFRQPYSDSWNIRDGEGSVQMNMRVEEAFCAYSAAMSQQDWSNIRISILKHQTCWFLSWFIFQSTISPNLVRRNRLRKIASCASIDILHHAVLPMVKGKLFMILSIYFAICLYFRPHCIWSLELPHVPWLLEVH